jgi:RimJ/RimL family protein N-acetyltransferase
MIRLRPLQGNEVEELDAAMGDPDRAGTYIWFGDRSAGLARRFVQELITDDKGVLAIETDDGELAGWMSWQQRDNGPPPHGRCWMIAALVLPEHRGKGVGTDAHRALAHYLFARTPAVRVEAGTEIGNVAERRALEHAGFIYEGTLRQAVLREGAWRDIAVYSILRSEAEGPTPSGE